jgi:hypothetical protein
MIAPLPGSLSRTEPVESSGERAAPPPNAGPTPGPAAEPTNQRQRRGVTAMEYLFMASLVIVGVILAVQHIGALTGGSLGNTAQRTNLTDKVKGK